ncbi:MAG: patatin-like phospholipase family protein, partial [Gallionellaceae bacterium]|nr:patatin-like phospholipase family protein [Gallionellaceae bacterium]
MDKSGVMEFKAVLDEELKVLGKPGKTENLAGLAFSGGGIRSATFNLGVIQALAENDKLGKFDYLSTVSGGGYIGSWLSAQIHRQQGKIGDFQKSLRGP